MTTINFHKYQGTGNDFIIIEDLSGQIELSTAEIKRLCDRRFGIGADGLMLVRSKKGFDFEMNYYNSNGAESTMCGNGGRCIVSFCFEQNLISETCDFYAIDGAHTAEVIEDEHISLGMIDVSKWIMKNNDFELFTGSPHYVSFQENSFDTSSEFKKWAKSIRHNSEFDQEGINVNVAVKTGSQSLSMRTFERGVEDETLSCGTGAVAAAISFSQKYLTAQGVQRIDVQTEGGSLIVEFNFDGSTYSDIKLVGATTFVFEGEIKL